MAVHTELGTKRIPALLFKYALPAIIAMTASSLYNIVDTIFIGHGVGPLGLAGLTIAKPFMDICAAFGSLVGVGAGTLVAIKLGEKNVEAASKVLGNVIILNVILSVIVMVIGIIFLKPILFAFGASEESLPYAYEYMLIILLGNVPTHIYFGLNNILRSAGHPYKSMIATIVAVGLNVVLDPIFIFTLNMGVKGAALATVISQCVAVVWQLTIFFNKKEPIHFHSSIWRLDWDITYRALSIGMSPFLMNLAHCMVVVFINYQLRVFGNVNLGEGGGDTAIAAYGVINRFTFVFAMIVMGLNQGMQPIAGYNYGARNLDRVLEVFKLTAIAATVITAIVTLLGELCPYWMVSIFTHDEELINVSIGAMRIILCLFFVVGFQMVTGNFFTSIGMAGKAIFLSLTRQILFLIPLIIILPIIPINGEEWGLDGVWWSLPISDTMSALVAAILLFIQLRKFKQRSLKYKKMQDR